VVQLASPQRQFQLDLGTEVTDQAAPVSEGSVAPPRRARQAVAAATPPAFAFGVLAEQYLAHLRDVRRCSPRTVAAYRSDYRKVSQLLAELGRTDDVRTLTSTDLQLCISSLTRLGSASVIRLINALSSLFRHLAKQGIIPRSPVDDLDRPRREHRLPRHASPQDVECLLAACRDTQERLVVATLALAGLRRSELLSLRVGDVSADLKWLRVAGKGRKERPIPVHPALQSLLAEHIPTLAPDGGPLIRNQAGHPMSATSLHRLFQRLAREAGLADHGLHPHSLRHHFASELVRQGVDVATVAELLGHSNISTTSIYLHSDSVTKVAAVALLRCGAAEAHPTRPALAA
jgi:integrase/recombinase XerD